MGSDAQGASQDTKPILVIGGYGDVGGRVCRRLADATDRALIIAGRRAAPAQALAASLGAGATGRSLDVRNAAQLDVALEGVSTVVMCLDDVGSRVLTEAVVRGMGYVDITADRAVVAAGRMLAGEAECSGARAVLGIGLTPGITNLLAASVASRVDDAHRVTVGVLISLYDEFGAQALDFMLEAGSRAFPEPSAGSERMVRPYTEPRAVQFGDRSRPARWFPFSDQFSYGETLGVDHAATLLALDPPWVDRTMGLLAQLGVLRLSASPRARQITARLLNRVRGPGEPQPVAISAEATGRSKVARAEVEVVGESEATAAALALAAARLGEVEPGVWLPEQAFAPETFLKAFAEATDGELAWATR